MKNTLITVPDQYRKIIFILILAACVILPLEPASNMPLNISAPIALVLGLIVALVIGHPYIKSNKKATTMLLQVSVVLLGFHLDLEHAMKAGSKGFIFTVATIGLTLIVGYFLGKWLKIDKKTSFLISNGTAICGGSAIAAVAPVIEADEHEITVSLGTVFILNSIALLIFPSIGHMLHMSAEQFGTWCAIAIHDTSSVVGAANNYKDAMGNEALSIATTIKLERALWIIPIALVTAYFQKNTGKKLKLPYFILYFIVAIIVSTYLPLHFPFLNEPFNIHAPFSDKSQTFFNYLYLIGKKGLVITLFLIGSGMSLGTIRKVGFRPILQGILLWILIGSVSLFTILHTLN
jgi:uncharacterized integral membrane protein (TIGR00698 family)